jgi:hypothetical protein
MHAAFGVTKASAPTGMSCVHFWACKIHSPLLWLRLRNIFCWGKHKACVSDSQCIDRKNIFTILWVVQTTDHLKQDHTQQPEGKHYNRRRRTTQPRHNTLCKTYKTITTEIENSTLKSRVELDRSRSGEDSKPHTGNLAQALMVPLPHQVDLAPHSSPSRPDQAV